MSMSGCILDQNGKPISFYGDYFEKPVHRGARSLDGSASTPWHRLYQPEDSAFLADRKALTAKAIDAYRNDPQIKGAVDDKVRLIFGNRWSIAPVIDRDEMNYTTDQVCKLNQFLRKKFNREMYSRFNWIDSAGKKNLLQLLKLSAKTRIVSGESFLKVNYFDPRRSPFGFNLQTIDQGRIDTPVDKRSRKDVKAGLLLTGKTGYVRGAYVHKYHTGICSPNSTDQSYEYVPYRTKIGNIQMLHVFEEIFPDQTRGITQLASMIMMASKKEKMIDYSMEDFIAKAQIALVIKSNKSDIAEAFGIPEDQAEDIKKMTMANVNGYMENSKAWHEQMGIQYGNKQLLRLYDGESLDGFSPESSTGSLSEALDQMCSMEGRAIGFSREHYSQRWNDVAYSGSRAGMLTVKRTIEDEKILAAYETRSIFDIWMSDGILRGEIELPNTSNQMQAYDVFLENRDALTSIRCDGPAWDEIDQSKTVQRFQSERDLGMNTFERFCQQFLGEYWEDVLDQKETELKRTNELLKRAGSQPLEGAAAISFLFPGWEGLSTSGGATSND